MISTLIKLKPSFVLMLLEGTKKVAKINSSSLQILQTKDGVLLADFKDQKHLSDICKNSREDRIAAIDTSGRIGVYDLYCPPKSPDTLSCS